MERKPLQFKWAFRAKQLDEDGNMYSTCKRPNETYAATSTNCTRTLFLRVSTPLTLPMNHLLFTWNLHQSWIISRRMRNWQRLLLWIYGRSQNLTAANRLIRKAKSTGICLSSQEKPETIWVVVLHKELVKWGFLQSNIDLRLYFLNKDHHS